VKETFQRFQISHSAIRVTAKQIHILKDNFYKESALKNDNYAASVN